MEGKDKIVDKILNSFIRYEETADDKMTKNMQSLGKEIVSAVKEIKQPDINITVPEVKIPEIIIPPTQVTVQERPIKDIEVTGFAKFVESITSLLKSILDKKIDLSGITKDNPVPVVLTHDGKFYKTIDKILTSGSSGHSSVNIKNKSEVHINPATEESLSQIVMVVANSLSATTYDLNAAAYSGTTSITNDYILDSITFDFSTAISKTITITTAQGTKLYEATNSLTNLVIPFNQSFNGTENITVAVTQTAGACTMDMRLKTTSGSNTLVGDPTVNQGTSPWVTSSPDVIALMPTALGQGTMAQSMKVVLPSDQTVIVRDTVHEMVHNGRFFSGGHYNATLADNGTIRILIQTGATYVLHVDFDGAASGYSTVQLYEGTTFSAAGTAITMSNHNRGSANTFQGTITHTPTITAVGTQINGTEFIPGGSKGSGAGGDFAGFGREWDLLPSTNYLISLTNVSGGVEQASLHLNVYFPTL